MRTCLPRWRRRSARWATMQCTPPTLPRGTARVIYQCFRVIQTQSCLVVLLKMILLHRRRPFRDRMFHSKNCFRMGPIRAMFNRILRFLIGEKLTQGHSSLLKPTKSHCNFGSHPRQLKCGNIGRAPTLRRRALLNPHIHPRKVAPPNQDGDTWTAPRNAINAAIPIDEFDDVSKSSW